MKETLTQIQPDTLAQTNQEFLARFQLMTRELRVRCQQKATEENVSLELAYELICLEDLTDDALDRIASR